MTQTTSKNPAVQTPDKNAPVAIGGMGGSGTRLIAQIVEELGYYLGSELNKAKDNLLFTLLFKRKEVLNESSQITEKHLDILLKTLSNEHPLTHDEQTIITNLSLKPRPNHDQAWLKRVAKRIGRDLNGRHSNLIAWKEPNTHVLLEKLLSHPAGIKYLHVMRDGLDMSYSDNQQQLLLWGEFYLKRPVEKNPVDALDYWNAMHTGIFSYKLRYPDLVEIVSYDKICRQDDVEIRKIYQFIGIEPTVEKMAGTNALIIPPSSIGRSKKMESIPFCKSSLQQYQALMNLLNTGTA